MISSSEQNDLESSLDAIIIGAGFSGLYMIYRLREAGFSVQAFEAADNVGGTWYWNRYPGARCDIESVYYNYTFSKELLVEWNWSSRYATQPEILRYINHVADKFELRKHIEFNTRVETAHFDEANHRWVITTDSGKKLSSKYLIAAIGCLSASNVPNIKGLDHFNGEWYHTGRWPHEKVDFTGKRVGIIGTGSSGIQAIPVIAKEAEHLTVFQRTPQYSAPAKDHPYEPEFIRKTWENYSELRQSMQYSMHGVPIIPRDRSALEDTPEVRQHHYEEAWEKGGLFTLSYTYNDHGINETANHAVADFVRGKIREVVSDPETAEKLMPNYYYATKRPIIDTDYFETYNRKNVTLVDVKETPIEEITTNGLRTTEEEHNLDILVFATGFDAITGPLFKIDLRGRNGMTLKEKWDGGANLKTYLGIATAEFPNFFMITGPQSPSVLSNMMVSIEQHVEWVTDFLLYLRKNRIELFEATKGAEEEWSNHCNEVANFTLLTKTDSWYMGANIDGKPRGFLPYAGGVGPYRQICNDVAAEGYKGFSLTAPSETAL
jgi:cation diffusion facilitator CzcD-associated flavoprotein CzcO